MNIRLDWNKYTKAAVDVSAEGMVMLENNGCLPLKDKKVALFGRMQNNYYKSGTGSGGMVNVSHVVTVREALEKSDKIELDAELLEVYEKFDEENPVNNGIGWGNEPWSQEEFLMDEADVKKYAERVDTAIMVIARSAGEDRDNCDTEGAYRLSANEEKMIEMLCASFKNTIILLNTGNIIDMNFVKKYNPSAVLYIWQAGMVGALAIPEVLAGAVSPSGHLTDTIAKEIEDYPSDKNFGKGDVLRDNYQEDIFVGYRFFETFAQDKVLYPFGYGLTYTTFEFEKIKFDADKLTVSFMIRNTGNARAKCVPMVFCKAPSGKLGKPSRVLCGFTKTSELLPNASEFLTIKLRKRDFASFDDKGACDPFAWVLEPGTYEFYLGENVRDAVLAGSFDLSGVQTIDRTGTALAPIDKFERMREEDGKLVYEDVPTRKKEAIDTRLNVLPKEEGFRGDMGISFADVKNGKSTLKDFIAQLDDKQLSLIVRGEGMGSPKVTTGTAGAFAGLSRELRKMGVPSCCCSDGPSGMRIDSGKKAFALPNGTCIAATFNTELIERLFTFFGIEMLSNHIDVILGPGMNIHRHPLNGRNFEYFSEDPYLTGRIACAELAGLHKNKVTGCIKHFCLNNREFKRLEMSSNVSERALREIYLKGFEMAVKDGGAKCIMTVYNRVNGTYGSSNYELTTEILRNQWGFTGIVMSDWWAFICAEPYGEAVKSTRISQCARAQNDLYMCCPKVELENINDADVYEVLCEGDSSKLVRADLERCARNVLGFALETPAMDRVMGIDYEIEHIDSPFADDDVPVKADVYFDIDDGLVLDMTRFDTEGGHDAVFGINVLTPGKYLFDITASSELNDVAQIPMTFFYTSIPIGVITWNGTSGADVTKSTEIFCSGQPAIIRLQFSAPGVKLKSIKARYVGPNRDDNAWDFA